MTRVTLEDGLILTIKNLDGFSSGREIVKVEKQVKDLTLAELIKLDMYRVERWLNGEGVYFVSFDANRGCLNLDLENYIDITSIIKGEQKDD